MNSPESVRAVTDKPASSVHQLAPFGLPGELEVLVRVADSARIMMGATAARRR